MGVFGMVTIVRQGNFLKPGRNSGPKKYQKQRLEMRRIGENYRNLVGKLS